MFSFDSAVSVFLDVCLFLIYVVFLIEGVKILSKFYLAWEGMEILEEEEQTEGEMNEDFPA